ncbi:MAG: cytochrome b/b6 domain-containing protein [Chloroflexi bacterium]|nr:cytochrome b/b6 domain-containing protein [Chloroflexota bacterium]
MNPLNFKRLTIKFLFSLAVLLIGAALWISVAQRAEAQEGPVLHPTFSLLDEDGVNVLDSGKPVSTMQTCGACHDTAFIEQHSFHSDVGLSTLTTPGQAATGLPWDFSNGIFGEWNPLTYRYLSPEGDPHPDLTTAEWLQVYGSRHAGGGPAQTSRSGDPLTALESDSLTLETSIIGADGELSAWDWQESGVVEMSCFLCHMETPNVTARTEALQAGNFGWANTATLIGTGVVDQIEGEWLWNPAAFTTEGELIEGQLIIQDPTSTNCGACHGLVQAEAQTPLVLEGCEPTQWSTITTGQIFSPQRLADTGVNLSGKEDLGRSYDVHAERVVSCTDCHYALNNPIYYREDDESRPDHLLFDPRRIDLSEYLYRPLHQFAKGSSPQGDLASEFDNTIRRCETCHDTGPDHDWLPYADRHMSALSCETCHIPELYAPSRQTNDWTVLRTDGKPFTECRGVDSQTTGATFADTLIKSYQPVLLPRENKDGSTSLSPYNMITSWYWVAGDPARPVAYRDLQAAWLDGDTYPAEILDGFDTNGDGALDDAELVIDTQAKTDLIAGRLAALGLDNPRIMGDIRPYSINHNVTDGSWAIKDCQACHSEDSRVNDSIELSDRIPNGVMPVFVSNSSTVINGELKADGGRLTYQPRSGKAPTDLYIFGHDNVSWVDGLGALMFVGTLFGVTAHSGLRYRSARRRAPREVSLRREYMYSLYERQWHWLQTAVIMLLILTGLIIHKPDLFGAFSFSGVVLVHNILAAILVINAGLALFYHLASGQIRQFLPEPHGFFGQSFAQAIYYARGIFNGDPHPMQKTPDRKMNPLQQLTYLAILNILLPGQIITGAMMWGAQTWPDLADQLGGLPFLAPLHTLIAWTFATFIVAHVYLTTTAGHTPAAGIQSMITGWDHIETHDENHADHPADDEGNA